MPKSELFIGGLGQDIQRKDIEDVFEKYGRIIKCDVKSKGPGSSFCFVEYEDERDAEVWNSNQTKNNTHLAEKTKKI